VPCPGRGGSTRVFGKRLQVGSRIISRYMAFLDRWAGIVVEIHRLSEIFYQMCAYVDAIRGMLIDKFGIHKH
jgi:hypothetical protein